MHDIIDLYEEDSDPKRLLICLDEKSKQLLGNKRMPIPIKPGSAGKYDYELILKLKNWLYESRILNYQSSF
jgi:hypothetical protein